MSIQWLLTRFPGFEALSEREIAAITDFVFLWTLFEFQIMENYARAGSLYEKMVDWHEAGIVGVQDYETELQYFRQRYFIDGNFSSHFDHLRLRKSDYPELVRSVLDGSNDHPRDCLVATMMVVWRFRNNLFHGEKWSYQLQGQFENFTHGNTILVRLLDRQLTLSR